MSKIEAVRGMPVIPPPHSDKRRRIEDSLIRILLNFGYAEMRVPIIERTELFKRSIGDTTDIVEKEMYEFADKKGLSICLRPEATAGMMRGGIGLGMFAETQRIWCLGPMFRYERPQSGRARQFDQLDVEAVGFSSPSIDAELIWLSSLLWEELNITPCPILQINALGSVETRQTYSAELKSYLEKHRSKLDEDSQRRLNSSPLRIMDSKSPETQSVLRDAPVISSYWDDETRTHINGVTNILDSLGIPYEMNNKLVRGLDYYDKMVFEWVSGNLGAQNTVCAGGRYDGLIKQLGGKETPAVGFALGMERLMLLLEGEGNQSSQQQDDEKHNHLSLLALTDDVQIFTLLQKLRGNLPNFVIECDFSVGSLKNKLKRASKKGVSYVLIVGDDELAAQQLTLRDMRQGQQETLEYKDLINKLKTYNKEYGT